MTEEAKQSAPKFPPRGFATRFVNEHDVEIYFHAFGNKLKAEEYAGTRGTVVAFVSLQEHTEALRKKDERIEELGRSLLFNTSDRELFEINELTAEEVEEALEKSRQESRQESRQ